MAARIRRIVHDENTRAKIQTSQIVNRLTNHVFGEIKMSATQVRAAEILLKKTLPDTASVEMVAEIEAEVEITRIERVVIDPANSNG
jgi:hypothetical protein